MKADPRPLLRASDLLSPTRLRGPGYEVSEPVEICDDRFLFRLQTDYGEVTALGMPMLHRRLQEHASIQALRKKLYSPMIFQGVLEAVKEAPAGAFTLLTDPIGSLLRYPRGLRLGVRALFDPLERRGGSEVRRGLALSVGADPETRNPILATLLNHLALRKRVGKTGTRLGLSQAVPYWRLLATPEKSRVRVSQPRAREVARDVTTRLTALEIPRDLCMKYGTSMLLTSNEKRLTIRAFETLRGVRGLKQIVATANELETETELLSYLQSLRLLAALHRQDPIDSIQADWISLARQRRGGIVAFAAVDILLGSREVRSSMNRFRQAVNRSGGTLLVAGAVTAAVRTSLDQDGISVIDLTRGDALYRAA